MCETKTKVCSKCGEEKPLTSEYFHPRKSGSLDGFRGQCRICIEDKKKKWREENPDKVKRHRNNYVNNNREKISQSAKKTYYKYHDYYRNQKNQYWNKNKEQLTDMVKRKKQENPFLRLYDAYRSRVYAYFVGKNKSISTMKMLGCSQKDFRDHIEKQFQEGMNWDNYGIDGWHIDHHIPLASAQTEEDLIRLNHYTNFQPLWAEDNLRKSDKISEEWGNLENTSNTSIR